MLKLKRILLIAPAEMVRTPAFERAHALACATGACLHIVAFDYVPALALAGLFDHQAMAQAREGYLQVHRQWLEQQGRIQKCVGLQVTTEVVWSKSSPAHVLEYVNDFHPDLVIKDFHYVSALGRAFHQPVDLLLLRDCPAHLHLVAEGKNSTPLKILAAMDLSHLEELSQGLNDRIVDVASTLAASSGAALHVLSVNSWAVVGDTKMSVPTLSLCGSLKEAVIDAQEEAFEALADRYGIEEERRHLLTGLPHKVIRQFAQHNAFDLLVLGTAYHHRGSDMFLGSTAEQVLTNAQCSLMFVKPLA